MIPDWQTNCVCFSKLLADQHSALCGQLVGILQQHGVPVRFLAGTRDIWCRDYCPIQVQMGRFVKFRYDPDYLKGYPKLRTEDEAVCEEIRDLGACQRSRIVLDGGNVVASESRAILTEKIYDENPKVGQDQLKHDLRQALELTDCLVIPTEPDDLIGHADGVVRFLSEGLVVVNDYSTVETGYGARLRGVLQQTGFPVEELPYFQEGVVTNGIPSAVGNYVNFLRVGNLFLVPAYGVAQDDAACRKLEQLCPDAQIVPVPCVALARQGGVLNCVSWTIKI